MSLDQLADFIPAQLAVLATFDPKRAPADAVAGGLLESCSIEVEPDHGQQARMLSESARIEALASVLRSRGPAGLGKVREDVEPHYSSPLQRMLDAFVLKRDIPLADRSEDELAASMHVERWSTAALARANLSGARVRPTREEIEGRIRILDVQRPISAQLRSGFVGRGMELARLKSYSQVVSLGGSDSGLVAFIVYGVGGMGKSALVARFVKDLIDAPESSQHVWAYLDFDRPTLRPQPLLPRAELMRRGVDFDIQPKGRAQLVLEDIVRQVGAQHPNLRNLLEREVKSAQETFRSSGLESLADEGVHDGAYRVAKALRESGTGGKVVIVLDTFEEVERRGEEVQQLYEMFDKMAGACPTLRLVVSGRTPATSFRTTPDNELHIGELSEHDAWELLQHFVRAEAGEGTIDLDAAMEVWEIVGRSPLSLKLAARAIAYEGIHAFTDAARRAQTLGRVRDEFVRGFLYHRIIDHLRPADPTLRDPLKDIARAGLVLRGITWPAIEHILLPGVGRDRSSALAKRLFEALGQEGALVRPVDSHTLGVREELRGPALSALRLDDAALVRRVHEMAAAFHASGSLAADPMEAFFHRLAGGENLVFSTIEADIAQSLRGGLGLPPTFEVVESLERSLPELPRKTRKVLASLRKEADWTDDDEDQVVWERTVVSLVDASLRAGNPKDAREFLHERETRLPATELYRLEIRICEAEGDLDGAIAAAQSDVAAAGFAEQPARYAGSVAYLAKLLEWRGHGSEALGVLAKADSDSLLTGEWPLRLELTLNRLATAERTSLENDDTRWEGGLLARHYLSHFGPSMRESSALIRLLAAVLGRDELKYIREAMLRIGLDPRAEPKLGIELGRALAEWDRKLALPDGVQGKVARAIRVPDPANSVDRWIAHVSGLGSKASDVFGDAFWALGPPLAVIAGLRAFYLHSEYQVPQWVLPKSAGGNAATHFLDSVPLDYSRTELRDLESHLLAFYPKVEEFERLASVSGLDRTMIDWNQPHTLLGRALLNTASTTGRMAALLQKVLGDASPEATQRFRDIIGPNWLARHIGQ